MPPSRFAMFAAAGLAAAGVAGLLVAQSTRTADAQLQRYRNLGKAFYENPATQPQAVGEFKKALDLAPNSLRERINYGLSLLRAGNAKDGIAELEKAQKQDPTSPYTWFNLAVAYKRQGDLDAALTQFRGMEKLVPKDAVTHYQIGSLLKAQGDVAEATREFETARDLNPLLAAPHFQLYGLYRQADRAGQAAAELKFFQDLKKSQEGAAIPEDMEWNFYAEIDDPIDAPAAAPPPAPVYRADRVAPDFTEPPTGVAAIALDGLHPSLIAWSRNHAALYRNGKTLVANSGLESLRDIVSIAPGDFDNDGLPDLCVLTAQGAVLYRNAGGRFVKQSDLAQGQFRQALWLDFDHDYDLDLFLLGDDSKLLRNNGTAGFGDETKRFPFVTGHALAATRFDFEPDTPGFDLIVSYQDRPGLLYRDKLAGAYEAVPLDLLPPGVTNLDAVDFNHDGRTDIIASPSIALVNRPNGFTATAQPGAFNRPYAIADYDVTGRNARASITTTGSLQVERDTVANYGNWIEIALTGVKNVKSAVGAKVEVRAGLVYDKQTYQGVPLVFRLGAQRTIETVRITWPNGLIQNELTLPVDKVDSVKEAPRLSGSCPMIFTWNGSKFQFISDVLGVAPLGASSGDGQFFPVDHDEYVSIPSEALEARNGSYEVRVTEELHEVSYIDQIKLIALDHPHTGEIVTNEKFKSPPFPEFRLFGGEHRVYPVAARDNTGANVLPKLLHRDFTYPDSFRRDSAGVAEMHTLDLDFGQAAAGNRAVLILYGWVDWADGSTFLSSMQEHKDLTFPYLQVKDANGNWKTVVEDMGIPSGKPKPMAVDLTGKFLSASREVRIVTNLCVYWDEAYLYEDSAAPANHVAELALESADLHFRGFSKPTIHPERKQPEQFDYQTVSPFSNWNPTSGLYTRYGAVADLLREPDDRPILMGSGDEVALKFSASGLPVLPQGWRRDYLLLVDGWAKDADANTAFSQTVLPLPFHGMTSYPYPAAEHYPADAIHEDYQRTYNTRPALRLIRPLRSEPTATRPERRTD